MAVSYDIIFQILATIGGLSGIVSAFKWFKNKRAKVKILSSLGEYYFYQDELFVHTKLQITNEKEDSVFITDIVALMKENPSKTKDKKGRVFNKRPTTTFSPTKIEAKGTIEIEFTINFSTMDIHPINRVGLASSFGFLDNGMPIIIVKESIFDEKWDQLPLEMKLFIHINGKEITESMIGVFAQGNIESHGTLNVIQIAQLERDYLFDKKK